MAAAKGRAVSMESPMPDNKTRLVPHLCCRNAAEAIEFYGRALGATVTEAGSGPVDMMVLGSREGTPDGRLELSASAEYAIETATSPVLAVPRRAPVAFAEPALSSGWRERDDDIPF